MNLVIEETGEIAGPIPHPKLYPSPVEIKKIPPFMKTAGRVYSRPHPKVVVTVFDPTYKLVRSLKERVEVVGKRTIRKPRKSKVTA